MMTRKPVINCLVIFSLFNQDVLSRRKEKWSSNFIKVKHKGQRRIDEEPKVSRSQYINKNIFSSVNDILNRYDDTFVLSAIYEDILSPVIDEAVIRKSEQNPQYYPNLESEKPHISSFITRPESFGTFIMDKKPKPFYDGNLPVQNKPKIQEVVLSERNTYGSLPLRDTRLGRRMKKGIDRLKSSIPKWQSALQLVGTAILALILPSAFVQFG